MGSGMLCLGCNLREENPAPQARRGCRLSLPAFMRRARRARRVLWEAMHFIMRGIFD